MHAPVHVSRIWVGLAVPVQLTLIPDTIPASVNVPSLATSPDNPANTPLVLIVQRSCVTATDIPIKSAPQCEAIVQAPPRAGHAE
jgi:hypothetical protein